MKQRGIFNLAEETSKLYMNKYSSETIYNKILAGKKLSDYFNRAFLRIMGFMVSQIDFFDSNIFKNKGSLFTWTVIAAGSWFALVGSFILSLYNHSILTYSFLVFSMIFLILSGSIAEKRAEKKHNT